MTRTVESERSGRKPLFSRDPLTVTILIVMLVAGALHWALFIHNGNMTFRLHDWWQEYIYYSVIRQAIASGQMPYHMSMSFHGTDRFLAIPYTNRAPQILLLPKISIGRFILVDLLIFYSLGFIGCLLIKRKYGLSLIPFSIFFLLFNFNGHITGHIAVGHSAWSGYFLLPFLLLFMFEIFEGKSTNATPFKLALILFAMMVKGSFHLYIWSLMFLLLLLIFNWRHVKTIFLSILLSAVLSIFRLLPAAFTLLGRKEKFIWSYPTFRDLFDAMITIRQQSPERLKPWGNPGWWEHDIYIGIIGLAIIAYFGIYLRFSKNQELEKYRYPWLDMPLFIMTLFSVSYFHAFFTRIPLSFLKTERVATRFIIIPVVLLALLSSIRLEHVLRSLGKGLKLTIAAIGTVAVISFSLIDHSYIWSVARLERATELKAAPPFVSIIAREDGTYKAVVVISALVTLAALATTTYLLRRALKKTG